MSRNRFQALCGVLAAIVLGWAGWPVHGAMPTGALAPVDLIVFAPHPDDEVLGAAGVLQQALTRGQRVRVVFVTNGDGYPQAASTLALKSPDALSAADYLDLAQTRQREAIAAAEVFGLTSSDLVFLGYPDAYLERMYQVGGGDPVRSAFTGRSSTYGREAPDYHTRAHGRPSPYTRAGALVDIEEVLRASAPARIFVTDKLDQHPDHRATFELVRDAISAIGSHAELLTYDVHGGQHWPWPHGLTPDLPLESRTVDGVAYPIGLVWPPSVRVPLTKHQSALKLQALMAHRSQWRVDSAYLESFVKSEEVFWTGAVS